MAIVAAVEDDIDLSGLGGSQGVGVVRLISLSAPQAGHEGVLGVQVIHGIWHGCDAATPWAPTRQCKTVFCQSVRSRAMDRHLRTYPGHLFFRQSFDGPERYREPRRHEDSRLAGTSQNYPTPSSRVNGYGRWLGYLTVMPRPFSSSSGGRVTASGSRRLPGAGGDEHRDVHSTVLFHVRQVLLPLAPDADWSWHMIAKRIHAAGQPRSKAANLRMSDELYRLGFNLMDEADEAASERTKARDTLATHKNTG